MSQFILLCAMILHGSFSPDTLHRRVLLFGTAASPLVKDQWQLLQNDSSGLEQRDLEIEIVPPGSLLYKTFAVSPVDHFTIILVGKDGGEKYRSTELTSTTQLFALIDAMPMRKAEIRNQKKNH